MYKRQTERSAPLPSDSAAGKQSDYPAVSFAFHHFVLLTSNAHHILCLYLSQVLAPNPITSLTDRVTMHDLKSTAPLRRKKTIIIGLQDEGVLAPNPVQTVDDHRRIWDMMEKRKAQASQRRSEGTKEGLARKEAGLPKKGSLPCGGRTRPEEHAAALKKSSNENVAAGTHNFCAQNSGTKNLR